MPHLPRPKPSPKLKIELTSASLLKSWGFFARLPGGKKAFSLILGKVVPYSGSVGATVETLEPGRVMVKLRDRRPVRNHLRSVHAMALANLGELSTGLALNTLIPPTSRAILSSFEIRYLRKARGWLTSICDATEHKDSLKDALSENKPFAIRGEIVDSAKEKVAEVQATWIVGPRTVESVSNDETAK